MCLCFVWSGVDDEDTDTGRFWAGGELGVFALLPIRGLIWPLLPVLHRSQRSSKQNKFCSSDPFSSWLQQQVFKHKKGFVAANLSGVRLAEWVRVHFSQYIQEEVSSALELLSSVFEFFSSVLKLQCTAVCSDFSYILKEAHCPVCWSCTVCSDKLGKTANTNTEDEYKDNSSAQAVRVCIYCCGEMSHGFVSWQIHLDYSWNCWSCLQGTEAVCQWVKLKLSLTALRGGAKQKSPQKGNENPTF